MARVLGGCPGCGARDRIVFDPATSLHYAHCENCKAALLLEQLLKSGLRLERKEEEGEELRGQRLRELIA
ncbi:hypothetical protein HYW67_00685 [Candidatus Parcubacteria bacterium]|nr:hypothetical protein [Candidatus Parcubacteria bacterium]